MVLQVQRGRLNIERDLPGASSEPLLDAIFQQTSDQLIDAFAIPQTVHIGLAQRETPTAQHAPVKGVVMNGDIVIPVAVDLVPTFLE